MDQQKTPLQQRVYEDLVKMRDLSCKYVQLYQCHEMGEAYVIARAFMRDIEYLMGFIVQPANRGIYLALAVTVSGGLTSSMFIQEGPHLDSGTVARDQKLLVDFLTGLILDALMLDREDVTRETIAVQSKPGSSRSVDQIYEKLNAMHAILTTKRTRWQSRPALYRTWFE
jgi:hypothetical protein